MVPDLGPISPSGRRPENFGGFLVPKLAIFVDFWGSTPRKFWVDPGKISNIGHFWDQKIRNFKIEKNIATCEKKEYFYRLSFASWVDLDHFWRGRFLFWTKKRFFNSANFLDFLFIYSQNLPNLPTQIVKTRLYSPISY